MRAAVHFGCAGLTAAIIAAALADDPHTLQHVILAMLNGAIAGANIGLGCRALRS